MNPYSVVSNENPIFLIACGGVSLTGMYILTRKYQDIKKRNHLTKLRIRKQKERQEQFELLERKYPWNAEYAEIVSLFFEQLLEKLQQRELTAIQVLEAFVSRAIVLTREFNCATEFNPKCFELAAELDSRGIKGPLQGVPFCVKDDHDVQGLDTTLGYSMWLYQPKAESAVMVKILQDAGGIPFCKTNLPQTVLSVGSDNPIYGTTLNPLNKALSPGGSSSGTGCLVGAGGAPFGLGSDIGGSVRIPAHFCGISTLKSTIGRLSTRGIVYSLEDSAGIVGVPGILAPTAKTLAKVYEVTVAGEIQNRYDPLVAPLPWKSEIFEARTSLRIGYFTSLDIFPALGDTPETILKAKTALESLGHTLVPFELPCAWEIAKIAIALFIGDNGNQAYNKLKHDEVSYVAMKFMYGRTFLSLLWGNLTSTFKKPASRRYISVPGIERSEVLWEYLKKQREAKYMVLDSMDRCKLDLILMPVLPFPAVGLKEALCMTGATSYTHLWNVLDFPAGVVPFGKETCDNVSTYNDEGDSPLKLAKEAIMMSKGMPIGVQIVGKPFQEEMVLRALNELEVFKMNQS